MLARMTIDEIVQCCKESQFFTVIADSVTDFNHNDQMSVMVRFVALLTDCLKMQKNVSILLDIITCHRCNSSQIFRS